MMVTEKNSFIIRAIPTHLTTFIIILFTLGQEKVLHCLKMATLQEQLNSSTTSLRLMVQLPNLPTTRSVQVVILPTTAFTQQILPILTGQVAIPALLTKTQNLLTQ